MIPEFAQKLLEFDPAELRATGSRYPIRGNGDGSMGKPQWVEGDNEALFYRGRALKRGKMWFQSGEPETDGFVKYYYTGWQRAVLPATSNVAKCDELVPVVEKYNSWAKSSGYDVANHFIVTHYVDGEHNIGMHFDKPRSISPGSLITIVKTGAHGRPFRLEDKDGGVIMERVLAPGTAVVMTLEANCATKHGVPAVPEAGSSGSIVFRTIGARSENLESELEKFYSKKRKAADTNAD